MCVLRQRHTNQTCKNWEKTEGCEKLKGSKMLSKHRLMNALIRNKSISYNLARFAANNSTKDGLAQSILSNHTQYSCQNERNINTFTRRLFSSDSNEVCVNGKHFDFPKTNYLSIGFFSLLSPSLSPSICLHLQHFYYCPLLVLLLKFLSESHSQLYPSRIIENMLFTI